MTRRRSAWWKLAGLVGLAGMAGVAASGVAVARDERRRQAYTPDEVRARLHARLGDLPAQAQGQAPPGQEQAPPGERVDARARSSLGAVLTAIRRRISGDGG